MIISEGNKLHKKIKESVMTPGEQYSLLMTNKEKTGFTFLWFCSLSAGVRVLALSSYFIFTRVIYHYIQI